MDGAELGHSDSEKRGEAGHAPPVRSRFGMVEAKKRISTQRMQRRGREGDGTCLGSLKPQLGWLYATDDSGKGDALAELALGQLERTAGWSPASGTGNAARSRLDGCRERLPVRFNTALPAGRRISTNGRRPTRSFDQRAQAGIHPHKQDIRPFPSAPPSSILSTAPPLKRSSGRANPIVLPGAKPHGRDSNRRRAGQPPRSSLSCATPSPLCSYRYSRPRRPPS